MINNRENIKNTHIQFVYIHFLIASSNVYIRKCMYEVRQKQLVRQSPTKNISIS